jgi:hypothetical protein
LVDEDLGRFWISESWLMKILVLAKYQSAIHTVIDGEASVRHSNYIVITLLVSSA